MTDEQKKAEKSEGGSAIYRHDMPSGWEPAKGDSSAEQIEEHISEYLGDLGPVFHELASDTVHIDVHTVEPNETFPFRRLVTAGMSDLAMTVPAGAKVPDHLELVVTLPEDWRLDEASLKDEGWYWPIRLTKMLARFPHKFGTWLGHGHTMPNGDPPRPYAEDTKLAGVILLPPLLAPKEFDTLRISPTKLIRFLAVVPLYPEELDLKLRSGTDALLDRLDAADVNEVIRPQRRSVA